MSQRAESLANRIKQGAAGLAAFAEGLSEAEWRTKVSATDPRSIGVIVHHVASVYPLEVEAARIIATGQTIVDVTWDSIRHMNAEHAAENSEISKADALELLRRKSEASLPTN